MVNKKFDFKEAVTSIDFFGNVVAFNTDGKAQTNSYFGALASLFIIVITLVYTESRFMILTKYGDTSYQTVSEQREDQLEWFNQTTTGFNLAVGVLPSSALISMTEPLDTTGYLELSVNLFSQNTDRRAIGENVRQIE